MQHCQISREENSELMRCTGSISSLGSVPVGDICGMSPPPPYPHVTDRIRKVTLQVLNFVLLKSCSTKQLPESSCILTFSSKCRGTPSQGVRIGYKNTSACIDTPVTAQVLKLNPLSHQQRQKAPFSIVKKKKKRKIKSLQPIVLSPGSKHAVRLNKIISRKKEKL